MKISCILTSFNRPKYVRQALRSVEMQTHKDYELFVMDESNIFDIHKTVAAFKFPSVVVKHYDIDKVTRSHQGRMSIKINDALRLATGDLICYLCDDDYYFPNWFHDANEFFEDAPQVTVAFGVLLQKETDNVDLSNSGGYRRFFNHAITEPAGKLNHNQVIHRRLDPPLLWPEERTYISAPDAYYFAALANAHVFVPLETMAAVRREHSLSLQKTLQAHVDAQVEGARE